MWRMDNSFWNSVSAFYIFLLEQRLNDREVNKTKANCFQNSSQHPLTFLWFALKYNFSLKARIISSYEHQELPPNNHPPTALSNCKNLILWDQNIILFPYKLISYWGNVDPCSFRLHLKTMKQNKIKRQL